MHLNVYLRSDGIGYLPREYYADLNSVGYISKDGLHTVYERVEVLQESTSWWDWCASSWETIPHDELWILCRPGEKFTSQVNICNLDFIGTPFEHRYNEYVLTRKYWARGCAYGTGSVGELAEQEGKTWGIHYEAFIPFKKPNPQGYQGVFGQFQIPLADAQLSMLVHDAFDDGIHALKVGK